LPPAAEGFVNCDESRRRFALRQLILSLQHRPLGIKHGQKIRNAVLMMTKSKSPFLTVWPSLK
jgi:hypothetical protein